jgi:hypothetical protein
LKLQRVEQKACEEKSSAEHKNQEEKFLAQIEQQGSQLERLLRLLEQNKE